MTTFNHQADLDDLIASCRSEGAKRAFAEAVAAYRAGAYRACIVTTWIAVLFDYLGKLRDLDLSGNKGARELLDAFQKAHAAPNIPALQKLENDALRSAREDFELLTPIEERELERLREDRNRCAHPSMSTVEEPYQPSAEQARSHMRNAVMHMLSKPPVQGKAAWTRIWNDVNSDYFPETKDEALERLKVRLAGARDTLITTLLANLIQGLLTDE